MNRICQIITATGCLVGSFLLHPEASGLEPSPGEESLLRPVIHRDLSYAGGDGNADRFDLWVPASAPPPGGFPVVMVVHGGGWISGDKWTMSAFSRSLIRRGMAAMVVNYRLAPTHLFPSAIDDLRDAMIWAVDHSDQYRLDVSKIGLWGYSAGAQISLVTALSANQDAMYRARTSDWTNEDPRWDRLPKITAVVGGGSPCEFQSLPPENQSMAYWLGGTRAAVPDVYRAASPTAHLDAADPPILLIHGTGDIIVPVASAHLMAQTAVANEATCEVLELNGHGHITTFTSAAARRRAADFLEGHLMGGRGKPATESDEVTTRE